MDRIATLILPAAILGVALMYRFGVFRGRLNSRFNKIINLDEVIFPGLEKDLADRADILCFWICITAAALMVINSVLSALFPSIPNVGLIYLLVSLPGAVLFRLIYFYKKTKRSRG
jgi:hypothetical protein